MAVNKVAFIIDKENSTLYYIAHELKKNLKKYRIDIIPSYRYEGNIIQLLIDLQEHDIIHFLDRNYFSKIDIELNNRYIKNLGFTKEQFYKEYCNNKITFAVCDHQDLSANDKWKIDNLFQFSYNYYVVSKRLYDIYQEFEFKPKMICYEGVDTKKYSPKNIERFKQINDREIVVGWAGNSKFVDSTGDSDAQGLNEIIIPAIYDLQKEGINVKLEVCDKATFPKPQDMMPEFFRTIDLYLCTSKSEGSPVTIMQAMACGVPIITTDVGIVKEIFGRKQSKYIMEKRSSGDLKYKIKSIINNDSDFYQISKENRYKIKKYDWKIVSKQLDKFLKSVMKENNQNR